MSKFLKNFSIFFVFALVGYSVILFLWSYLIPFEALKKNMKYPKGGYGHMYSRAKEVKETKDVDILFMGSSHAYRGFDPRIFKEAGYKTFNLGSSNQTPIQALALLRNYIDNLNPKLVIYEVYPGIFQNDGVESSLDLIANDDLNWEVVKMALEVNSLKTYNALIYDCFLELFLLYEGFNEAPIKGEDVYVQGGYVQKNSRYLREQKMSNNFNWKLDSGQWDNFVKIVDLLEKRNIKLLMVQSPMDSEYSKSIENKDETDQRFRSIGEYVNFNDFMYLKYKEDLYDLHHLYQGGVVKFNNRLIERIKKEGYLE